MVQALTPGNLPRVFAPAGSSTVSRVTSSDGERGNLPGPTSATYDADAVAAAARRADPGLPEDVALRLAGEAWQALRSGTEVDGPAVARVLLAGNAQAGATACNMVATAAVEFVTASGVPLP